ncbi:hypothetical protein OIV83_005656 [Microbotryomycetes sp. JL201]|nr:hypothetical protein OIV83_005656 [Microbotryomycetes sp. JL201]
MPSVGENVNEGVKAHIATAPRQKLEEYILFIERLGRVRGAHRTPADLGKTLDEMATAVELKRESTALNERETDLWILGKEAQRWLNQLNTTLSLKEQFDEAKLILEGEIYRGLVKLPPQTVEPLSSEIVRRRHAVQARRNVELQAAQAVLVELHGSCHPKKMNGAQCKTVAQVLASFFRWRMQWAYYQAGLTSTAENAQMNDLVPNYVFLDKFKHNWSTSINATRAHLLNRVFDSEPFVPIHLEQAVLDGIDSLGQNELSRRVQSLSRRDTHVRSRMRILPSGFNAELSRAQGRRYL